MHTLTLAKAGLVWIDWACIALYALVILAMGVRFSRGQKGLTDYFLAGRSMGWAVMAISFTASLHSGIHTLATVSIQDHYRRWIRPGADDAHYLRVSRLLIVVWGVLFMAAALLFRRVGSIIDMTGTLMGPFAGCIVGMFLLGTATRRARPVGVLIGAAVGYTLVSWAIFGWARVDGRWDAWAFFASGDDPGVQRINWLWYPVISLTGTFVPGYLVSLLFQPGRTPPRSAALNIWDRVACRRGVPVSRGVVGDWCWVLGAGVGAGVGSESNKKREMENSKWNISPLPTRSASNKGVERR